MNHILLVLTLAASNSLPSYACAQAWRDCIPNSIGPGGCDSIGLGGGKSMGPGGGLSIAPGGGLGPDRDRSRGLDPRTMQPFQPLQQW